ncbi:MAG: 50S ribosomal protein L4 [bacterium]|nr:50S ribosomal protein L4 [bacterium]
MELPLYNQNAENIGTIELADNVFGLPMNQDLLHQVITSQMSNKRQVLAHTKGRGEVRGGGKKPWKQKGTGRARHGSTRSPIWRSGGVTGGPTKEKNFKKDINKKMMQKALKVALSSKVRDGQLFILDALTIEKPKTKEMDGVMKKFTTILGRLNNVLLVTAPAPASSAGTDSAILYKSARNLPYLDTIEARNLNPLILLEANRVILSKESLAVIENQWGTTKSK